MAGRSNRKKVQVEESSQAQRSYQDLSRYEVARVNSALSAAANFGKNRNIKAPKNLKRSGTNDYQQYEESETESSSESSEDKNSELFTLTINKTDRHRLEKALKLLEFVEGGDKDHGSDYSLFSVSSSVILNNDGINRQTSTPRVQALRDQAYENY